VSIWSLFLQAAPSSDSLLEKPAVLFGIPITGTVLFLAGRAIYLASRGASQAYESLKAQKASSVQLAYRPSPAVAVQADQVALRRALISATPARAAAKPCVFLSYAHRDQTTANLLAVRLRSEGIDVWMDTSLEPGDQWRDEIATRIERAKALIVLMSGERPTEEVQYEIEWARRKQKPLLPVAIDQGMWFGMTSRQYVAVSAGKIGPEAARQLADAVRAA
jgi:hypothetical protein